MYESTPVSPADFDLTVGSDLPFAILGGLVGGMHVLQVYVVGLHAFAVTQLIRSNVQFQGPSTAQSCHCRTRAWPRIWLPRSIASQPGNRNRRHRGTEQATFDASRRPIRLRSGDPVPRF